MVFVFLTERYHKIIGNHRIRAITSAGEVTTIAGGNGLGTMDEGKTAQFNLPSGIAIAKDGILYVVNSGNVIKKLEYK